LIIKNKILSLPLIYPAQFYGQVSLTGWGFFKEMERVNFFVDGFNFYRGLKRKIKIDSDWQRFYWIDFVKQFI